MFGLFEKKSVPIPQRSVGLVDLTAWEAEHIRQTGQCPDCSTGTLLQGPEGGVAMNVQCEKCAAEFNIINLGRTCFGERIAVATKTPAA